MTYTVKLDVFEGPLDLLYHLIEKEEVDIYDIPIARIAEQYLEYLAQMQELNLDLAGEFLVMAATLLDIKARMLLPQEKDAAVLEEELPDPREELVAQLLEYKKFKSLSRLLWERLQENSRVFGRPPSVGAFQATGSAAADGLLPANLWEAFQAVLARAEEEEPVVTVLREDLTVGKKITQLLERLAATPKISFQRLFDRMTSRLEIVVTFLSLLEMVRRGLVRITQRRAFSDIEIIKVSSRADGDTGKT